MPSHLPRQDGGTGTLKTVQCNVCSKKFSRTDHLKRHQLRHTGVKPYSCIFCGDGFTRSDNLRDHYPGCTQRRNRPIPEAARGGRRSHACDTCTAMKLGCDGKNPCNTCRQRNITCKFARLESKGFIKQEAPKICQESTASDRGSINFLLNSGTASFIEGFSITAHERRNIFNFRNTQKNDLMESLSGSETGSAFSFENESTEFRFFDDENLMCFLSTPFASFPTQAVPPSLNVLPAEWEAPSNQSATIVRSILQKAIIINNSPQEQSNINQHLNYLFLPSKIARFVNVAFDSWHPNCPILHTPSFNIDTAPLPLLTAVAIMGGLYSRDETEVNAARFILDVVELYIFSSEEFMDDYEIRKQTRSEQLFSSALALPNLQAAYIMLVVQFWAGSMSSRRRAIDTRFGTVIKVARRLQLTKVRHDEQDVISEALWVQKECEIRLINIICLFDCALNFFANFPCRLTVAELQFDLICEERFFFSHHPFSEPGFMPSRHITTYDAFQSLFGRVPVRPGVANKGNLLNLNATDLFTLIHLLYVCAYTQMTLFSPATPLQPQRRSSSGALVSQNGVLSPDSNINILKAALARWRLLWSNIRANMSPQAWSNLGFFRSGMNYFLITQLIINNRESSEILKGMEVGCEDTLQQLKSLLKQDGASVAGFEGHIDFSGR